jgi:hypothetical protein
VFANDVTNALAEVFPSDPPRFLARTPHGYHEPALIRSELEKAGFSSVVIETRAEQSRASSPRPLASERASERTAIGPAQAPDG